MSGTTIFTMTVRNRTLTSKLHANRYHLPGSLVGWRIMPNTQGFQHLQGVRSY